MAERVGNPSRKTSIVRKLGNLMHRKYPALKVPAARDFYSLEETKRLLENERALADRYEYEFSLVAFELIEGALQEEVAALLRKIFLKRLRSTDKVGWIDKSKIGVILPYASAEVAQRLAEEIVNSVAASTDALEFKIYCYPSHWAAMSETSL